MDTTTQNDIARIESSVEKIIRYENGEMERSEILNFFGELIASGLVWELQGHYGRVAADFIRTGIIDEDGKVLFTKGS